jgi:Zn-dependent peptidase ImmA (M78 family)
VLPADCNVRIDIVNYSNSNFEGFAWYSGRIKIFDGNFGNDNDRRRFVLLHEIGHVCGEGNRYGSYNDREIMADNYAYSKLQLLEGNRQNTY